MASVGLDIHVEAPAPKKANSAKLPLVERRNKARIAFDKSIEGRYKDGLTGYAQVDVLLMYWEADDLKCKAEVVELDEVFQKDFGFTTEIYKIPSRLSESKKAIIEKVSDWSEKDKVPNKLNIIYYGGHGGKIEGGGLRLIAHGRDDDQDGSPPNFFNLAELYYQCDWTDTDTLLIVDCCYSAQAFDRIERGRRKFELLSSSPPSQEALAPRHAASFTKSLCESLKELYEESDKRGFSTSALYRKLYFSQPERVKPFLFDQSPKNYGRIWLRPFLEPSLSNGVSAESKSKEENIYIELRLHLSKLPNEAILGDLATHMQYLTHVHRLQFRDLHAPEEQLREFMNTMIRAQKLKPLLRRVREKKARRRLEEEGISSPRINRRMSWTNIPSESHDWSESVGEFPGEETISVRGHKKGPSPLENAGQEVPLHNIGNLVSYAYILHTGGPRNVLSGMRRRAPKLLFVRRLFTFFIQIAIFFITIQLNCLQWFQKKLDKTQ